MIDDPGLAMLKRIHRVFAGLRGEISEAAEVDAGWEEVDATLEALDELLREKPDEGEHVKKPTDEEFMKWAQSLKPCKYCNKKFVGPVCPNCECLR